MKRLWIAAAILAAVGIFCAVIVIYQVKETDELTDSLLKAVDARHRGETDEAYRLAKDFADECKRDTDLFFLFINHTEMNNLRTSAAILPDLLVDNNEVDFYAEAHRCYHQLDSLRQIDLPTWGNIL